MTQPKLNQLLFALVLILILSPVIGAQKAAKSDDKATQDNLPASVWADPGDVSTLDLFYGSGGKEHAPDSNGKFIFVKEDMNGTSPKFDVEDENGVRWKVKLGEEPQAETAATRLLWAAGYFVDEDYFLTDFKVQGITKLHRGEKLVSEDGTIHHARFERHIEHSKKLGNWDWFHNQCGPVTDLNGLRIMMALVNNWDLKTINNSVEEMDGQRRCVVTDVGATFGKTGNIFGRSKSEPKDYTHSKFIQKMSPGYVDFVGRGKENVAKHIPLADAKWLGQRLASLSVDQTHDVFRAGGYTPEEIDSYTKTVQDRIAELNAM
jgi:hypothetical protein